ncbi:MAG TPA: radical SAM protein [Streptosporangiaceae bacterium]|nr:radical SAM protein [Streptosporangiaceae bacterium]
MDLREVDRLAAAYGVFHGDVMFIAMNLFGINAPNAARRARVEISLDHAPDDAFLIIVPMNRVSSPFSLDADGVLRLGHDRIGMGSIPDHDDAISGYFRKSGQVITLNPNARSRCTGCAFCPNTLEAASDPRSRDDRSLHELLDALALDASPGRPLSTVEEITISTGCFERETRAVHFLKSVAEVLRQRGMTSSIGFLTSVLRSDEAFAEIAAGVGGLMLFVTLECFNNRRMLLKSTKASLSPDSVADLMHRANDAGLCPTYNYIVGLDDLSWLSRLPELDAEAKIFPNYQVYQSHNSLMDGARAPGADSVEFYLKARRIIERSWLGQPLRPESWRNYRPLWYYTFGEESLTGQRI